MHTQVQSQYKYHTVSPSCTLRTVLDFDEWDFSVSGVVVPSLLVFARLALPSAILVVSCFLAELIRVLLVVYDTPNKQFVRSLR